MKRCLPVLFVAIAGTARPASASAPLPTVTVAAAKDTGTMHYAERVTIADATGTPLVLTLPDDAIEKGKELLPLFSSRILRAGSNRFVIIGWSSTGAGMQTMHAWTFRTASGQAPAIIDRLALTTDRASAGLVIDARSDAVRIGIPWTFDGSLHDADEWKLKVGGQTKKLADVRALEFTSESGTLDTYRAPFAGSAFVDTRVAWFRADASGFRRP
jgi:hypothetical protein